MGHQDKGHFAAKHNNRQINKTITEKIEALADNNSLTCSSAHRAGKALKISPLEIGVQTDLLEYQIAECQLGLFGYSDGKKRIDPDIVISPDLNEQLDKTNKDGRISCRECWNIAQNLKIKRLDVSSACEKKNIRIKPCQLGAF
ncbi:MAG: hypothetical protein K8S13_05850 [Desulfobacula sp.]|uniref:hypothetical protein n=1 Tax=Desulfobacula sp. TaxID=2593537 RepID=UPI0025C2B487|nr:hypothetical protein [Desulfobacula sp.]MCD4719367.1 hypothetical protein [Desulfobacula sp.]